MLISELCSVAGLLGDGRPSSWQGNEKEKMRNESTSVDEQQETGESKWQHVEATFAKQNQILALPLPTLGSLDGTQ